MNTVPSLYCNYLHSFHAIRESPKAGLLGTKSRLSGSPSNKGVVVKDEFINMTRAWDRGEVIKVINKLVVIKHQSSPFTHVLQTFGLQWRDRKLSLIRGLGGKFLKKLWCCVGGVYSKIIWFYQLG